MPRCAWPTGCVEYAPVELCQYHRKKRRELLKRRGVFDHIDAAAVSAHLRVCRNRGWRWSALEQVGKSSWKTLRALHNREIVEIRRDRARQILSISPTWQHTTVPVPAIGSSRRIRAMMWQGWGHLHIAAATGINEPTLRGFTSNERITARNAAKIAQVCQGTAEKLGLGYQPGPSNRSRAWALRAGAVPMAAWPEHSIDDPDAEPDLDALRVVEPRRRIDLDEVIERLSYGQDIAKVAEAMGFAEASVKEALKHRHRRVQREQGRGAA